MANKKLNQLVTKPSIASGDLFPIADATTGQLYKTTISDLGTAIGSGVSSVNGLVGAVVLDTDDIQELASPVNKWFTDLRARAAISVSSPLAYNSGTGLITIAQATGSANGYLSSTDWTTFNSKQAALSGTGFVKISGTTISYDNSTYLTTSSASSTYLALAGGTLTGALNGTSATFTGDLTISSTNPRIYLTDTDNNPDYFISNTDGTFTIYDVTSSVSRFTLNGTTGTFGGNLTVGSIIKSGGTSAQFLKADGSVDSTAYVSGSGTTNYLPRWSSSKVLTDSFVYTNGNYTEIQGQGLTATMGIVISGRYGSVANAPKIYSSDETTGVAHIELVNGGGEIRLGVEKSTGGQILPGSSAYATVLTAGLSGRNLEFGTNNTKRLTIDGSTGAATFSSSVTASSHIVPGGTSSQFLKANGTLDSTAYLPLSGGTLTGALSGTSATFSSTITSTRNDAANVSVTIANAYLNQGNLINFQQNKAGSTINAYIGHGGDSTGNFIIINNGTQALTITNSGNVGIGTTSPSQKLHVTGSGDVVSLVETAAGAFAQYRLLASPGGTPWVFGTQSDYLSGSLVFRNSTNKMVLTTGGNLGIGTDSPGFALEVAAGSNGTIARFDSTRTGGGGIHMSNSGGVRLYLGQANWLGTDGITNTNNAIALASAQSADILFVTNAANVTSGERMRIRAAGSVGINTSGQDSVKFQVKADSTGSTNYAMLLQDSNSADLLYVRADGLISTGLAGNSPYNLTRVGRSMIVDSSGFIGYLASTRESKTNISDLTDISFLYKLNPKSFNYRKTNQISNEYTNEYIDELHYGLIADEVEKVNKELVFYNEKNGIKELAGVEYQKLTSVLIKAVQELKAELDTLKNK